MRPDAAAPVVVHAALQDTSRVRLDPERALAALGAAAAFDGFDAISLPDPRRRGLLGLPVPPRATPIGLGLDTTRLATQFGVLAQAAYLSRN